MPPDNGKELPTYLDVACKTSAELPNVGFSPLFHFISYSSFVLESILYEARCTIVRTRRLIGDTHSLGINSISARQKMIS